MTAPVMSVGSRRGRSVFIHSWLIAAIALAGPAGHAAASFTVGLSLMPGSDGEDLVFASGSSTGPIQNRSIPVIDLGLTVPARGNLELGFHVSRTTFASGSFPAFDLFQFHTLEAVLLRMFASGAMLNVGGGVGFSNYPGGDRLALTHFGFGVPVPGFQRLIIMYTHMIMFNINAGSSGTFLHQTDRAGVTVRI